MPNKRGFAKQKKSFNQLLVVNAKRKGKGKKPISMSTYTGLPIQNNFKRRNDNYFGNKGGRSGTNIQDKRVASVSYGSNVFNNTKNIDNMRFKHSELLAQVYGSDSFSTESISINPGIAIVFPWLAQLSGLWDCYKVDNLVFRYVPACSTTTPGNVMMGFDYDAYDAAPIDKQGMMMLGDSCSMPSWSNCNLRLPRKRLDTRGTLFIRGYKFQGDQKTYDLGTFIVATQGQVTDDSTPYLGDIFVDYDIVLKMPQQDKAPIVSIMKAIGTTGQDANAPLGTNISSLDVSSNPPGTWKYVSAGDDTLFTLQTNGQFLISIYGVGTVLTVTGNDWKVQTNMSGEASVTNLFQFTNSGATGLSENWIFSGFEGDVFQLTYGASTTVTRAEVLIYPTPVIPNFSYVPS